MHAAKGSESEKLGERKYERHGANVTTSFGDSTLQRHYTDVVDKSGLIMDEMQQN